MNLVIDASVAAKWFFNEKDTEAAFALLEGCHRGEITFLAPALLGAEVANLIWKKVVRGSIDAEHGYAFWADFQRIPLDSIPDSVMASQALRLAVEFRHSVYDCLYVAVAVGSECALLTADRKLFNVFNPVFPQVRFLADLQVDQ